MSTPDQSTAEHEVTIEQFDSHSKYGRRKRQYHATCSCGWANDWWPVQKWAEVKRGDAHLAEVLPDRVASTAAQEVGR